MYRYETHMHTMPVSGCAKADVRENVLFYKEAGYDGIFITNHFPDGNINNKNERPYSERIKYYFSDYDGARALGEKVGLKVFLGIETSNGGTDFLIYGLDKEWYLSHPEIDHMVMSQKLLYFRENGAFIVQAHPFREAGYIDHIRLYPRHIDGVEVINACRSDFENEMAGLYAQKYGLYRLAGSDNHVAGRQPLLAGIECETPITSEQDYINAVKSGKAKIFTRKNI